MNELTYALANKERERDNIVKDLNNVAHEKLLLQKEVEELSSKNSAIEKQMQDEAGIKKGLQQELGRVQKERSLLELRMQELVKNAQARQAEIQQLSSSLQAKDRNIAALLQGQQNLNSKNAEIQSLSKICISQFQIIFYRCTHLQYLSLTILE